MKSIDNVLQRIQSIERRFGQRPANESEFAAVLDRAMENPGGVSDTVRREVVQTLTDAARRHGVDPKLVLAVAEAESGFSPSAVSSAGAIGVMQLMPETAKMLGVRNIYDYRENADAGVRYLKQMLIKFDGDTEKALAAYNAGPDAVVRYGGIPPYAETREYVKRVLAALG